MKILCQVWIFQYIQYTWVCWKFIGLAETVWFSCEAEYLVDQPFDTAVQPFQWNKNSTAQKPRWKRVWDTFDFEEEKTLTVFLVVSLLFYFCTVSFLSFRFCCMFSVVCLFDSLFTFLIMSFVIWIFIMYSSTIICYIWSPDIGGNQVLLRPVFCIGHPTGQYIYIYFLREWYSNPNLQQKAPIWGKWGECCINSISYQFYSKFQAGKGDFNLKVEVENVKDLLTLTQKLVSANLKQKQCMLQSCLIMSDYRFKGKPVLLCFLLHFSIVLIKDCIPCHFMRRCQRFN